MHRSDSRQSAGSTADGSERGARRFSELAERPELLGFYAKERINQLSTLVRGGRWSKLGLYVLAALAGKRVYERYARWRSRRLGSPFLTVPVGDHELTVDLRDPGIARTLWMYGVHEEGPARSFTGAIARIAETVEEPVVLDIGANIGYYALLEAAAVGDRGTVFAIEPADSTRRLLRRNIEQNQYHHRIRVSPYAIAESSGRVPFRVSAASNRSRLFRADEQPGETDSSLEVPLRSVDDFLREEEVSPSTVNAIRMDVEGFELAVLEGMRGVLTEAAPIVMFFEVHPQLLSDAEHARFVSLLADHGFEVLDVDSAIVSNRPFPTAPPADRLEELGGIDRAYGLIVGKGLPAR